MDQEINSRGARINVKLVENAIRINKEHKAKLLAKAKELTGLENPNSPLQLTAWIENRLGETVESIDKKAIAELLKKTFRMMCVSCFGCVSCSAKHQSRSMKQCGKR